MLAWCCTLNCDRQALESPISDTASVVQAMLQTSQQTLEELHNISGPKVARLWADPSLGLMRFGNLRSLTLCELPAFGSLWMPRLPVSLQSLTIAVPPRNEQASVPDNRSVPVHCVCHTKGSRGAVGVISKGIQHRASSPIQQLA